MTEIRVLPVRTRAERELFLTFPWRLFRGDDLWVPPLLSDLRERIDPQRGVFFQRGTAEFFLAWRGRDLVGTICAAEDRVMNETRQVRECVFGFVNLVEDYAVMEALFARVRSWAAARGLNALTGPFNLDYEDSYGVLLDGRERPPVLMCGHTPAYYPEFFERYGFYPARGDNIAYGLDLSASAAQLQQLSQMAERVRSRGRFRVRPARMAHWEEELDRIHLLLNQTMQHLPDYRPWPREVVFNSLSPFRKIADPELILFAEEGDRTIGWLPGLPNLNEVLIHANGLRYPWDSLSLAWHARRQPGCLTVKSVLMLPEFWGSGAVILLFDEMARRARVKGYRWIDGSLTGEDNPRTPALAERLGAVLYKRYRVYYLKLASM
jgi:hypothetical protein